MADRTCPSCNKIFKYPSVLKKHLEIALHCIKTTTEINEFMSSIQISKSNTNYSNKCNHCNKLFTRKYNYNRHINNCGVIHIPKQSSKQTNINLHQPQLINNINNTNNTNNTINNNTTTNNINNTINNNNVIINIQHIYPFGFEKLPNISKEEMKKLLLSGDQGVIDIIKLVYEQDENKNFYKINLNKNNISYLSNQYKIDICQETELKQTLLKQCVILTYQMLILCSPLLSSEKIYEINSNLQNMSDKMKEEIYDNGLKNIIEYELRTNNKLTKDKITKYTKEINNNSIIKEEALGHYNTMLQLKDNTNKSLTTGISLYEINKKLGDPVKIPEMTFEYTYNDFNTKRFEYTTYLKYWSKRINDEEHYITTHPNKSLCDFVKLEERKKDINIKIDFMKKQSEDMRKCDNQNNALINKDNFKVLFAHSYINENQRIKD